MSRSLKTKCCSIAAAIKVPSPGQLCCPGIYAARIPYPGRGTGSFAATAANCIGDVLDTQDSKAVLGWAPQSPPGLIQKTPRQAAVSEKRSQASLLQRASLKELLQ